MNETNLSQEVNQLLFDSEAVAEYLSPSGPVHMLGVLSLTTAVAIVAAGMDTEDAILKVGEAIRKGVEAVNLSNEG